MNVVSCLCLKQSPGTEEIVDEWVGGACCYFVSANDAVDLCPFVKTDCMQYLSLNSTEVLCKAPWFLSTQTNALRWIVFIGWLDNVGDESQEEMEIETIM